LRPLVPWERQFAATSPGECWVLMKINQREVKVPVALPENWSAEADTFGSVVITAYDSDNRFQGAVTVSAKARGFDLGITRVYTGEGATRYLGRGWEARLYADAIGALQAVWAD